MNKRILVAFCLLCLTPFASRAADAKTALEKRQDLQDLSDEDLKQRISALDKRLKEKSDLINKHFAETQALETKFKDAQIDLEKKQISARKEKLQELTKKPVGDRKILFNAFNHRQSQERQKLLRNQQMERQKLAGKHQREIKNVHKTKTSEKGPAKKK